MTHELAPAVFVIHEVAVVREAIQGGQRSDELKYRTDFCNPLLIGGVRVRSDLATVEQERDRHPAIRPCGRLDVATMSHGKPMDAVGREGETGQ
jgi:hypothetical protein